MSEQSKTLMDECGIASAPKSVCFYKQHRYDRFSDTLNYAKSDTKRTQEGGEPTTPA